MPESLSAYNTAKHNNFQWGTAMGLGFAIPPRLCRLIPIWVAIFVLLHPIYGWGEDARADGAAPRADDWITINKDYSSQRFVDLDQITPQNVCKLKEVCEIQLNEPNLFSSGI